MPCRFIVVSVNLHSKIVILIADITIDSSINVPDLHSKIVILIDFCLRDYKHIDQIFTF